MINCLRCGRCCFWKDHDGNWRECRFLKHDRQGFFTCQRYHKRLGTHLGNSFQCVRRVDSPYNIKGCPYNMKGKQPHPFWGITK